MIRSNKCTSLILYRRRLNEHSNYLFLMFSLHFHRNLTRVLEEEQKRKVVVHSVACQKLQVTMIQHCHVQITEQTSNHSYSLSYE